VRQQQRKYLLAAHAQVYGDSEMLAADDVADVRLTLLLSLTVVHCSFDTLLLPDI